MLVINFHSMARLDKEHSLGIDSIVFVPVNDGKAKSMVICSVVYNLLLKMF